MNRLGHEPASRLLHRHFAVAIERTKRKSTQGWGTLSPGKDSSNVGPPLASHRCDILARKGAGRC
jgi:hypothetical protein